VFNYKIKEMHGELEPKRILEEFQKHPSKAFYDDLVENIADEMDKTLCGRIRSWASYDKAWTEAFGSNEWRHADYLIAHFEEIGLSVQVIPYSDELAGHAVSRLVPRDSDSRELIPIEYAVMHETLGLVVIMPLITLCHSWDEILEDSELKSDKKLVRVRERTGESVSSYTLDVGVEEFLSNKDKYIFCSFSLGGVSLGAPHFFGKINGKIYYIQTFYFPEYRQGSDKLSTNSFGTKADAERDMESYCYQEQVEEVKKAFNLKRSSVFSDEDEE